MQDLAYLSMLWFQWQSNFQSLCSVTLVCLTYLLLLVPAGAVWMRRGFPRLNHLVNVAGKGSSLETKSTSQNGCLCGGLPLTVGDGECFIDHMIAVTGSPLPVAIWFNVVSEWGMGISGPVEKHTACWPEAVYYTVMPLASAPGCKMSLGGEQKSQALCLS